MKDAAKWIRGQDSKFSPSNPCDGLIFKEPYLWMVELKSTKGSSISFNPGKPDKKPETARQVMIKHNQVKDLLKYSKHENLICGLILNFRPRELKKISTENKCYFVEINKFYEWAKINSDKSSVNEETAKELGVEISNNKKLKNYTYCIKDFIETYYKSLAKDQ